MEEGSLSVPPRREDGDRPGPGANRAVYLIEGEGRGFVSPQPLARYGGGIRCSGFPEIIEGYANGEPIQ